MFFITTVLRFIFFYVNQNSYFLSNFSSFVTRKISFELIICKSAGECIPSANFAKVTPCWILFDSEKFFSRNLLGFLRNDFQFFANDSFLHSIKKLSHSTTFDRLVFSAFPKNSSSFLKMIFNIKNSIASTEQLVPVSKY